VVNEIIKDGNFKLIREIDNSVFMVVNKISKQHELLVKCMSNPRTRSCPTFRIGIEVAPFSSLHLIDAATERVFMSAIGEMQIFEPTKSKLAVFLKDCYAAKLKILMTTRSCVYLLKYFSKGCFFLKFEPDFRNRLYTGGQTTYQSGSINRCIFMPGIEKMSMVDLNRAHEGFAIGKGPRKYLE
jgi:hypothetical protein